MNKLEEHLKSAAICVASPYKRFPTKYSPNCKIEYLPLSDTVNAKKQVYHISATCVKNIQQMNNTGTRIEYTDPVLEAECITATNNGKDHFFAKRLGDGTYCIVDESEVKYDYCIRSQMQMTDTEFQFMSKLAKYTISPPDANISDILRALVAEYGYDCIEDALHNLQP